MKNRREVAKHLASLGFTKGVEVGVDFAYHARLLLDYIPNLSLLCVDLWNRNPQAYELAQEVLGRYTGATLLREDSIEASKQVEDESMDFVFIDANHSYEYVKRDLEAWYQKVKKGGVFYGHNYAVSHSGDSGVIDAVDEFVANNGLTLEVIPADKRNPYNDDRHPCWYIQK